MSKKQIINLSCDFETLVAENETYVWLWGITTINESFDFFYGSTIGDFFEFLFKNYNKSKCYFHNLKFDGSFILSYLLNNGYEWCENVKDSELKKCFSCIISDMNVYYSITVKNGNKKLTFLDSLKILNYSVSSIAESFNLYEKKGKIDYKAFRPLGYKANKEEVEYIHNDTLIVAKALYEMFQNGFKKMTTSSQSLYEYKTMITDKRFKKIFPKLTSAQDSFIRKSYKGGFTFVNPKYKNKHLGKGGVIDNNSEYPFCYGYKTLPYGKPIYYKGKYAENPYYTLYVQHIKCDFYLKENKIPTIQLKNNKLLFADNEYIENCDTITDLYLTNVDLELFLDHYDVGTIEYIDGYMFQGSSKMFYEYVEKYTEQKIKAKKEKDNVKYLLAKIFLNGLYGKFGARKISIMKKPYLDENGILHFTKGYTEEDCDIYVPLASFVTSYARHLTITTAQKFKDSKFDRYLYSDTDSIHFLIEENENYDDVLKECEIDVDKFRLGAWDLELKFDECKYLRQKCYIEKVTEEYKEEYKGTNGIKVTIAGLPSELHKYITFNNFKYGLSLAELKKKQPQLEKLKMKQVKGGAVLLDSKWKIKT